jgi:hypothetical protein
MTPDAQQPEYWLFNAEQIATIQKALNAAVTPATTKEETQCICHAHRIILDAPCSRPHTPAPKYEHIGDIFEPNDTGGQAVTPLIVEHPPAPDPIDDREDRELNIRIAGFEEGYAQGKADADRTATLAAYERVRSECIRDESVGVTIFHILQELRNESLRQQAGEQG